MAWTINQKPDMAKSPFISLLRRFLRVTPDLHGSRFFIKAPKSASSSTELVWWATPLFLALMMVELADLVFAVDSVPAIFAVTTDPFIVYTSNIFAILGLRALYFALAAFSERFQYLKYSLAAVLVFVALKIFWAQIYGKVNPAVSLSVTGLILGSGIIYSIYRTRRKNA